MSNYHLSLMTEGEVVTSYRDAKNKRSQIKLLAELNCVSRETIVNILVEHNCISVKPKPTVVIPQDLYDLALKRITERGIVVRFNVPLPDSVWQKIL